MPHFSYTLLLLSYCCSHTAALSFLGNTSESFYKPLINEELNALVVKYVSCNKLKTYVFKEDKNTPKTHRSVLGISSLASRRKNGGEENVLLLCFDFISIMFYYMRVLENIYAANIH